MRTLMMTPHQMDRISQHADILLATSYSPWPLDIAAPMGAAQLIVQRLADMVQERLMGRTVEVDLGSAVCFIGLRTEWLSDYVETVPAKPKRAVLLMDRILCGDWTEWTDHQSTHWMGVDWWQWFRRRVPDQRWADACLYLSLAHPRYQASHEFRRLGVAPDLAFQMGREGETLLMQLAAEIASRLGPLPDSAHAAQGLTAKSIEG